MPERKGRSPAVWVSCSGLLIGEELAVGTVGEQVTGPQVQGDLFGRDLDLAQAARERRGLVELEQLDVATRRELFADATESFNFRFHSAISSARFGRTVAARWGLVKYGLWEVSDGPFGREPVRCRR